MTRPIDVVRAVAPLAKPNYIAAFQNGSALLAQHEINTPLRLAHFLAQVLHESGELRIEWENMNYSAERMLEIFGARHSAKVKPAEAAMLAHKPELIAERVYGLGNPTKAAELGNTHRGDGFLYRGGGLMQTTGRANYKRMGQLCGVDFENHPDLVVSAEHSLKPALGEWSQGRLNQFADRDDVLSISKAINFGNPRASGTPNGFTERRRLLAKVKPLIGSAVTLTGAAADTPDLDSAMDLLEIKRRLHEKELYRGEINSDYDRATDEAVKAWLLNQGVRNFEEWPELRLIIAAAQALCRTEGIDTGAIDGRLGPQTRSAFEIYAARRTNGGAVPEAFALFRNEAAAAAAPPRRRTIAPLANREQRRAFFWSAGQQSSAHAIAIPHAACMGSRYGRPPSIVQCQSQRQSRSHLDACSREIWPGRNSSPSPRSVRRLPECTAQARRVGLVNACLRHRLGRRPGPQPVEDGP